MMVKMLKVKDKRKLLLKAVGENNSSSKREPQQK
jgi:hypothetical protein